MMKRLLFMLAFLVSFGFAAVGQSDQENTTPEQTTEDSQESESETIIIDGVATISLDGSQSLADVLGEGITKVTKLIVSGSLTEDDFGTMKDKMNMLQILDMSEVTAFPKYSYWNNGETIQQNQIPSNALSGKLTLHEVIFPACLELINYSAFSGCNNLLSIEFKRTEAEQSKLKEIKYSAFENCSCLQSADLSSCRNLEIIGNGAFQFCNNLETVNLSDCTNLKEIDYSAFQFCYSLKTVNLRDCSNLQTIDTYAFNNCKSLESIELKGCSSLYEIKNYAFSNCQKLSDFFFSALEGLKNIGTGAFESTALSGTIRFNKSITQIGESAFSNCKSITKILFDQESSLSAISGNCFNSCESLTSVDFTFCTSLNTINNTAFYNCPALREIIIDNGYFKADDNVLYVGDIGTLILYPADKDGDSYTVPNTVRTIQSYSFPYNKRLKQVTIPSEVMNIQPWAFDNDFHLKVTIESPDPIVLTGDIGLGNSMLYVPEESLDAYKSKDIWNQYHLYKIGQTGFAEVNLDTITIAKYLEKNNISHEIITDLKIKGNFKSSDFDILRQMVNLTNLDLSNASIENNEVPENAFSNNTQIEKVLLPATITRIKYRAFANCSNLKFINLSELVALETVDSYAFSHCSSLSINIVFPSTLTRIGMYAFSYIMTFQGADFSQTQLSNIEDGAFCNTPIRGTIVFPETLTWIGTSAFNITMLTSITLKAQDTNLNDGNFTFTDLSTCELHVPYGSINYYQNANYWRDFSNIIEEEAPTGASLEITLTEMGSLENYLTINEINVDNVTELTISGPMDWRDIQQIRSMKRLQKLNMLNAQMENNQIPYQAFSDDYTGTRLKFLTEVVLPKELVSIEIWAFHNLNRLEKVVLPSTLKRLDGFDGCSLLSNINIEECTSLEYIGGFDGCTSLPSTLVLPNTVKGIGDFGNSSVTYIDLSQTSIESLWGTFANCSLTGNWDFPGTLSYISGNAFNAAQFSSIKLRNLEMVRLNSKNMFPAVDLNTFKIYVPNNLVETYKKDTYWYEYRNNIVGFGNTISVTSNNNYWGTVTGSGVYEKDDQITLQAICNTEYWTNGNWNTYGSLFVGWFEDNNILSENATCRFTADDQDHNVKAIFERVIFSNINGWVTITNYDTKSVTATVDLSNLDSDTFFTGWYEDDVCISKDQTVTIQVKDGSKERVISPRFEGKSNWLENTTISDANKVDGQDVTIYHNVTITGNITWKPNSITHYMPYRSFVVESPIETSSINLIIDYTNDWQYIYLPYNLNVTDIQCYDVNNIANSQFVVRYYDGEERAKNGTGNSWKQLKTTDKLEMGKGYIFRTNNGAAYKLNASSGMEALLTNQPVTIPLSKHTSVAAPDANWNLIGNPYPCYYNIGTLYENGFKGTITVWDPQLDNYQYYTQDDADQYLNPLTAFFVQQTDEVSSILFTTSGRAAKLPEGTTRSASALRSGDGRQVLNLVLSNDSLSDKTRIVFNEAAKAGYELGLDASKFRSMNPNAPAFYSIDADNQQLAINERPWDNGVVRLGCNFGVKGEYSIALQEAVEQDLILVDKVTGAQTNLKEQAYRFSAEVGESNDRFELRSGNPTGTEEIAGFQWQVRGGQLFLTGLPTNARVIVHDTMGRTVCDRTVSDELSSLALPQAGVYYLTIRTQQATRTERIMVKE